MTNRFVSHSLPFARVGRHGKAGVSQDVEAPERSAGADAGTCGENARDVGARCDEDVTADDAHARFGHGDRDSREADRTRAGSAGATDSDPTDAVPRAPVRAPLFLGLVTLTALGALSGWLALHAYQGRQVQQQRQLYLQVGRQAAVNLTSINYAEVDTDVQRILDSATGAFRDDFAQRSKAFIDVVKRAQSRSEGTITAAGLESVDGDRAQVVVAVMVKTTMPAAADDQARGWRMRIGVQKEGKVVKVSSVRFVE